MLRIKDRVTLGILCGALANIPKTLANEMTYRKGMQQKRYADIVGGIFMKPESTRTRSGWAFGLGFDFILSSFFGVPLVYILSLTGKDHHLLKSGIAGTIGFGVFRGLAANFGPWPNYPKNPFSNIMMSLSSTLWGVIAGALAVKWGDDSVFRSPLVKLGAPGKRPAPRGIKPSGLIAGPVDRA